jgi:hypothetical protein
VGNGRGGEGTQRALRGAGRETVIRRTVRAGDDAAPAHDGELHPGFRLPDQRPVMVRGGERVEEHHRAGR